MICTEAAVRMNNFAKEHDVLIRATFTPAGCVAIEMRRNQIVIRRELSREVILTEARVNCTRDILNQMVKELVDKEDDCGAKQFESET